MVENLKNPNYVQLIFGEENKIAKKIITEMRNNLQTKQKIYSSNKIKKTIRHPDFKKRLVDSFASAAS
jgi:phage pi2 protein 07